ncbi:MAG: DUF1080 domain-containing protein [Verrucomicrobiota bacterium]
MNGCYAKQIGWLAVWVMTTLSIVAADEPEWKPLFDGKFPIHWRGVRMPHFPAQKWTIQAGMIKTVPGVEPVDLVSRERFTNFEFAVEWRLAPGASSGILYLLPEPAKHRPEGLEYVIQDANRPKGEAVPPEKQTAALRGWLAPTNVPAKPVGEWNETRILVLTNHVEHWLNNQKVLEFELNDPKVKEPLEKLGNSLNVEKMILRGGYLVLRHTGTEVCFRNLQARHLPIPESAKP